MKNLIAIIFMMMGVVFGLVCVGSAISGNWYDSGCSGLFAAGSIIIGFGCFVGGTPRIPKEEGVE